MRIRLLLAGILLIVLVVTWRQPRFEEAPAHLANAMLAEELTRLGTAQAEYHAVHRRYSTAVESLPDWQRWRREDVRLRVDQADSTRWTATATWMPLAVSCSWQARLSSDPGVRYDVVARVCDASP